MTPPPDVSVVVATYNRADQLERLLAGLRAQTHPAAERFEVVVVDDLSGDRTPDVLQREREAGNLSLSVIRRTRRGGPAEARDEGWRASRAGLIAFTDDDCVPTPEWIAAGLEAAAKHPGAILQGRTEADPAGPDPIGPFSRTVQVTGPDPAYQTCNIFYPRSLLERVGGFDTEAFDRSPGGEDSDLAWRAIGTGAKTVFVDGALVHHAVNDLGPIGKLRVAARWTTPMQCYVRHPELRRAHFVYGFFWKRTHLWLASALLALTLRGRWRMLSGWLMHRYLWSLYARGKIEGGGPLLAPYFVLYDLVELFAVARAAVRYRKLML